MPGASLSKSDMALRQIYRLHSSRQSPFSSVFLTLSSSFYEHACAHRIIDSPRYIAEVKQVTIPIQSRGLHLANTFWPFAGVQVSFLPLIFPSLVAMFQNLINKHPALFSPDDSDLHDKLLDEEGTGDTLRPHHERKTTRRKIEIGLFIFSILLNIILIGCVAYIAPRLASSVEWRGVRPLYCECWKASKRFKLLSILCSQLLFRIASRMSFVALLA